MSHSTTFLFPLVFVIIAFLLMISDQIKASSLRLRLSMYFYILNSMATTLTSALGGSGIRKAEEIPGISVEALTSHAWFGALAFIFSLVLLFLAIRVIRKGKNNFVLYFLFIFTILYAIFYGISIYSSGLFFD